MRVPLAALMVTVALLVSSCGGSAPKSATATFRSMGVSFRYPSAWAHVKCHGGRLRNAAFAGLWTGGIELGGCYNLRPIPGGLSVVWDEAGRPGLPAYVQPTGSVSGQARSQTIRSANTVKWEETGCLHSGADLAYVTQLRPPPPRGDVYVVTACLRRPNIAANLHALRQMLASVRFTG